MPRQFVTIWYHSCFFTSRGRKMFLQSFQFFSILFILESKQDSSQCERIRDDVKFLWRLARWEVAPLEALFLHARIVSHWQKREKMCGVNDSGLKTFPHRPKALDFRFSSIQFIRYCSHIIDHEFTSRS